MIVFSEPIQFDWDEGNADKNRIIHGVTTHEAEEVFFDSKKVIYKDVFHSEKEEIYILIGKTKSNRLLYTVFALRDPKIRVISSRDINKKEVPLYEKQA